MGVDPKAVKTQRVSFEKRKRKSVGWAAASKLAQRHSGKLLAAISIIGTLSGVVGLYLALNPEKPISPAAQELLNHIPPKVGWHCNPRNLEPAHSFEKSVSAVVECQPVDPGPEMLSFASFTSEADLQNYLRGLAGVFARAGKSCTDGFLEEGHWSDAAGVERGQILCVNDDADSILAWTNTATLQLGFAVAGVGDQQKLHSWWQRSVKYEDDGPPIQAKRKLMALVPEDFGSCRLGAAVIPNAVAGITCDGDHGISFAGAALFKNDARLKAYIDAYAAKYPGITSEGCHDSILSYSPWGLGDDAKPRMGDLLCYVSGGALWFVWSTNKSRVYAYAARRDEDWAKLYNQWSNRLSAGI